MIRKVVCIGAGGHAAVVVEAARTLSDIEIVGFVDIDEKLWTKEVLGLPVIGGEDRLPRLRVEGVSLALMGIGSGRSCLARARAFESVQAARLRLLDVISPRAWISPTAVFGDGLIALVNSVIHTRARLGVNVLVNTGAIIEHDCQIADHCHVATGAVLAGDVSVGARTHIGAGCVIRQGIRIGSDAIIGAGAVVVKDVEDSTTVVGNPASVLTAKVP